MINHIRTLLLNSMQNSDSRYSEFIESSFSPVPLSSPLLTVQRAVVPTYFPRETRDYLASVISKIVGGSEIYKNLNGVDKREITGTSFLVRSLYPMIQVSGTGSFSQVRFSGNLSPIRDRGIYSRKWTMERVDNTHILIGDYQNALSYSAEISFVGDISDPIQLGTSGISFRVVGSSTVPAFTCDIEALAPIDFDIIGVTKALRSNTSVIDIFGTPESVEADLLGTFLNSESMLDSFVAVICAYVLAASRLVSK